MAKILITGASRGIGYETVLALAANPDNSILALSRNKTALRTLHAEAHARYPPARVTTLNYDLTDPAPDALIMAIEAQGGLDVLINNAGELVNEPFDQLTLADWRRVYEVNLFGVVALTQTVLPYLENSPFAHVVNIGSMGGVQGSSKFPGLSAYSSSKAALANLTECLAEEWKDRQIAVNCLALGAVQTEMLAEAFPGYQAPLSSADMGSFLAWFAVEGRRFFNGKILPVAVSTP